MDQMEWTPASGLATTSASVGFAPGAVPAVLSGRKRPRLEEHDGATGVWLRSPCIEVFVAVEPVFRVLSLRRPGDESLLADSTVAERGLRLAFMEPEQTPVSFEVGNRPAAFVECAAQTARVRLEASQGLRYSVTLVLESHRPRLRLEYSLENVGGAVRRVACWSVLSFARRGLVVVPLEDARHAEGRLTLPDWTAWPQPGVQIGQNALAATLGNALNGPAYKVGVVADAGWIAFQRGGEVLFSSATFDADASYPEGGANITFFEADDGADGRWCEIEHVGSLQPLRPGCAAHLSQTVELLSNVPLVPPEPDALRQAIESRLPGNGH